MYEKETEWGGVITMRLEVWQFMQDWVVRLRRRFLWSAPSVMAVVEPERGRVESATVVGVSDMAAVAERMEGSQEVNPRIFITIPPSGTAADKKPKHRYHQTFRSCEKIQFGDAMITRPQ